MIKIKHLLLLVLFCSLSANVFAQKGTRISGTVSSDAEGPLFMVNITERDKSNRIINATQSDMEGNFINWDGVALGLDTLGNVMFPDSIVTVGPDGQPIK